KIKKGNFGNEGRFRAFNCNKFCKICYDQYENDEIEIKHTCIITEMALALGAVSSCRMGSKIKKGNFGNEGRFRAFNCNKFCKICYDQYENDE
ncbi:hypothetical protein, partial [Chryseobacterium sp. CH25]|uniref:hypothetical protein n=1 Tax=Chryseobacterium sp. CH25 TaxID=713559 RepID=UPI0010257972